MFYLPLPHMEGKWIAKRCWEDRQPGLYTCVMKRSLPMERWMGAWHQHPTCNFDTAPAAHTICELRRCRSPSKDSLFNHKALKLLVTMVGQRCRRGQRLRQSILTHSSWQGEETEPSCFLDRSHSLALSSDTIQVEKKWA